MGFLPIGVVIERIYSRATAAGQGRWFADESHGQAIRSLTAAPARAMPLLQGRLKPVPVPDAQRISQRIADLDSKSFAARRKAETALAKLGELAEPAFKQVLEGQPLG